MTMTSGEERIEIRTGENPQMLIPEARQARRARLRRTWIATSIAIATVVAILVTVGFSGASGTAPGRTVSSGGSKFVVASKYNSAANAWCQPVKVYSQPPAGFDPLTGSASELAMYGFPQRPPGNSAGALSTWGQMVSSATTYEVPQPICGTTTHGNF